MEPDPTKKQKTYSMNNKIQKNYAFIDSQNVNLSIRNQGWVLDFKRFRRYLEDKYQIEKAFLFIGYVPQNRERFSSLFRKLMPYIVFMNNLRDKLEHKTK